MTHPNFAHEADEASTRRALWALLVGFFMILVDSTIVSVANPAIMAGLGLGGDYGGVIWVTSAYLLTYAVPLLITGRLGDRFGPRRVYLIGLVIFTLASLWCGLSGVLPGGGLAMLVVARAVQGLGASCMAPQTMAIITRTFPPHRRGAAMGIWGSVAGVAALVGPILGGVLVDTLGWEWIFIVNVPIGVVAFWAALRFVPRLDTHPHRFDVLGVVLFTVGMFLLVFSLQEGNAYDWGTIVGPISVGLLAGVGVVLLALFLVWQVRNRQEPLLPLQLLRDRNFTLANTVVSAMGLAVVSASLPLMFYLQTVRGLTPTQSALLLAPSAVFSGVLAAPVGRLVDRIGNPRRLIVPAILVYAAALVGYALLMRPGTPVWLFLLPASGVGAAMAGIWGPLSTTATRTLPPRWAGAGSGIYNTTRQLGSVVGSASIAALMEARVAVHLPGAAGLQAGGVLPEALAAPFATAMAESALLPAAVLLFGAAVAVFFVTPAPSVAHGGPPGR